MKILLNKNMDQVGFTLIEIMVALLIIGLISVSFLPIFVNSIKGLAINAGISQQTFDGQNSMENIIAGKSYTNFSGSTQTINQLSISFPGVTPIMVVHGKTITTPITYQSQVDHLTTFIPD